MSYPNRTRRQFASPNAPRPTHALKLEAAYGKVYVTGTGAGIVRTLPGAYFDADKNRWELSLTLETLKAVRAVGGFTQQQMAGYCSEGLLAWAVAAHRSEKVVTELHARIAQGERTALPWYDKRAGTDSGLRGNDRDTSKVDALGRWLPRAPFAHQEVMATVACNLDGSAFLCEMGTAKTRSAIEALGHHMRNNVLDMAVVVAPANVVNTWQREIHQWSDTLTCVPLVGSIAQRKALMMRIADSGMRNVVLVTNYEALQRMQDAITILAHRKRLGLILDEMHRVRTPQTKTSKSAMAIAQKCAWRLGMTGTPILNGIENIWSQWYMIDLGCAFGANFVQFRREFFEENPYAHSIAPLDDTASIVGNRIRRRGLRYRKIDCLDLPPKLYETKEVAMTDEQQRAYNQMRDDLLVRIRDMEADETRTASASIILTMMLRLSQITSGFLPVDPDGGDDDIARHVFEPNPKMDACDEIVREAVAQGQQVIIWARYRQDIDALAARLADLRVAKYYGGMRRQDKVDAENNFQAGDVKVLIGHPASGGVGLTLTAASTAIYYSQGYSLEHRLQSEDRCHRPGSERHAAITYIDIVCTDTIDQAVLAALAGKLEVAEAVTELRRQLGA